MADAAERLAREFVGACGTSCIPASPCAACRRTEVRAERIRAYVRAVAEAVKDEASFRREECLGDDFDLDAVIAKVELPEVTDVPR